MSTIRDALAELVAAKYGVRSIDELPANLAPLGGGEFGLDPRLNAAYDAARAALALPLRGEPVAWRYRHFPTGDWHHVGFKPQGPLHDIEPLYTTPQVPPGWQDISTAPKDGGIDAWFWIRPKSDDETYCDSSGRPIKAKGEPHAIYTRYGRWSALWKATHWMRNDPPAAPPLAAVPKEPT